jgi:hypothetical protein
MPTTGDVSSNFWVDVQVTDVPPVGTSVKLWPSQPYAVGWAPDTATNFTIATEFVLSRACALNKIWVYSQAGATQLPTACCIFKVATQAQVAGTLNNAPAWSGAAGSGWVSVSYAGVVLPAGDYKVAVVNGAGTPSAWNAQTSGYWSTGPGGSGITDGPLSAPSNANATSPGQSTYNVGAALTYPLTNVGPFNYWVDVEVTPIAASGLLMASFP